MLKKHIVIIALISITICCATIYTYGATGIVSTDDLRLRESNSTSSEILTLLSVGEKVEIISKTENGWYKVKYKEYEGYLSADFVNVKDGEVVKSSSEVTEPIKENNNKQEENDIKQEETIQEETSKEVKISKDEEIYGIPLINTNAIIKLEEDTLVKVLTEINGWSYVRNDNIEGWIRTNRIGGN